MSRPRAGLQEAARAARYRLLLGWCGRQGVLHLLVAHQADDQAETYALRAERDSGPMGLAAMSAVVEFPEARLLRPLLPVARARLTASLRARAQTWIDDPSNSDPRFARGQLRRDGLPMPSAAALRHAAAFAVRRVADEGAIADALACCATPHPLGAVLIDHALWLDVPAERSPSVLAAVIAMVAGTAYPPRRDRTQRVVAHMRAVAWPPGQAPAGVTLGGCRILWRGNGWLVVREPASIVGPGGGDAEAGLWDGRFDLGRAQGAEPGKLPVSAASRGDWAKAWPATPGLPVLLAALPCGKRTGRLYLLPVEGGCPQTGRRSIRACFRPLRPLAAGPFFPCFDTAKGQIVN